MKVPAVLSKKQIIQTLCFVLPLIFTTTVALLIWQEGTQFHIDYLIPFILIPLIAGWLLERSLFKEEKIIIKTIRSITILCVFSLTFAFSILIAPFDQVKHYEAAEAEQHYISTDRINAYMPKLSQLGNYSEIDYYSIYQSSLIFYWYTDHLICRYTPEDYVIQKVKLDDEFVFQSKPIYHYSTDPMWQPSADIDGYHFRILSCENYDDIDYYYPKRIVIIGYSDETYEIVYISYDDTDLDYITSLENFIIDNCGWEYIL